MVFVNVLFRGYQINKKSDQIKGTYSSSAFILVLINYYDYNIILLYLYYIILL